MSSQKTFNVQMYTDNVCFSSNLINCQTCNMHASFFFVPVCTRSTGCALKCKTTHVAEQLK